MFEWIKEHKILTAGLVIAAIVLFLLLRGRSAAPSVGAVLDTSQATAGGNAQQAAQVQAQAQASHDAAQVQANQDSIGGQIALANITANTQNNANDIAGNVALQDIGAKLQAYGIGANVQQTRDYYAYQGNALQIASNTAVAMDTNKTALATTVSNNSTAQQIDATRQYYQTAQQVNAQYNESARESMLLGYVASKMH